MTSQAGWPDVYIELYMTLDHITFWSTSRKYFCSRINRWNDGVCPLCWTPVCLAYSFFDGTRQ